MAQNNKSLADSRTYVTVITLLVAFISFLILMYGINAEVVFSWEKPVQNYLQKWNSGLASLVFTYWTELGSRLGLAIMVILFSIWVWRKQRDYVAIGIVPLSVFATDKLNSFIKELVGRDRPSINPAIDAVGYSFPSGHAMMSIVTYGLIFYFVAVSLEKRSEQVMAFLILIVLVGTIGISRIVLSAHYPTDVVAGYCLGLVCLLLTLKLYKVVNTFVQGFAK